jgi:thiamine monophosphate kinase
METTFVITPDELNIDFLSSLKKLFKHQNQLQISVSVPEDFNLLQTETPKQHLERLEKCLNEVNAKKNIITFSEEVLDEIIFEKL